MKKRGIVVGLACLLLLSACGQTEQPETPANAVQADIEKEDLGSVFAHTATGDFFYRSTDGKTVVTYKTQTQTKTLATLDGTWRFSLVEGTRDYPQMLFDGFEETAQGYVGRVYAYVKDTGVFVPIFEEKTSNAVLLLTADESYADLAWMLVQAQEGARLCPLNLRDGSTEAGQIVSLAETAYVIEGENVLVSLKTDAENPLKLTIENKAYEGSSVLATTAYIYDFSEGTLTKIEEE